MRIDIYYHVEQESEIVCLLKRIAHQNDLLLERMDKIMSALDDLQAAVTAEDTVIDSAIVLISGIPALIAAAGVDPAKLAALQADITAKTNALAAAVTANTPTSATTPSSAPAGAAPAG